MDVDVIFGTGKKSKRPPVKQSVKKQLLFRSKGRCEKCGKNLIEAGIPYHIHHKDGDRKNNCLSNLMLVCPNCHEKLTHAQRLKGNFERKKSPYGIEIPEVKVPEIKVPKIDLHVLDFGEPRSRKRRKKSEVSLF